MAADPVTDLLQHLQREWATLASAPFTFIITLVLAGGAAFTLCTWGYKRVIDGLREQLASKDERLNSKDQLLDQYRERINLTPAIGSKLAQESHADLQVDVLKFVVDLRDWLARRRVEAQQRHHEQWIAMARATDEVQKKTILGREHRRSHRFIQCPQ
jgi:hypothetical protein